MGPRNIRKTFQTGGGAMTGVAAATVLLFIQFNALTSKRDIRAETLPCR
jgi:hypothetical protein